MRFVGVILLLIAIPIFSRWYRSNPAQRKWAYAALGALPFITSWLNVDAAIYSLAQWPGYAKGLILTPADVIAIGIILNHRGVLRALPFVWVVLAYSAAVGISIFFAEAWIPSLFYFWQMGKLFLVFVACGTVARSPQAIRWLCFGLAAGAIFQAGFTIQERLTGALQADGTMGHQNLLGMMLHFVTLPLLAVLLAGERSKLIYLGVAAGLTCVALGASRGATGFVLIGVAMVFVLSFARKITPQKWKIVGFGALALAVIVPLMAGSLARRFEESPWQTSGGYDERAAFEMAASSMWSDHPMGVGANQYVITANTKGYSDAAGVAWNQASRSANVHHLYLLAGSETGYLGFITIILLFAVPSVRGGVFAVRYRRSPRAELAIGFTVAIIVSGLHGLYEWIWVMYQTQSVFAISLGITAGLIRDQVAAGRRPMPEREVLPPKTRSRRLSPVVNYKTR